MRRHICFCLSLCLVAIAGLVAPKTSAAGEPKKKMNILFILADDMRRDTIAALGNAHIKTPNLDKLAKGGTSFTRAYIQGGMTGAVCMPSRAMIMTGRSFLKITPDLKGRVLLGELLRKSGYVTFATGKWHNFNDAWLRSFQMGKDVLFGGMADHYNVPLHTLVRDDRFEKSQKKGKHASEIFADASIEFLKTEVGKGKNAGKPFFLYVAFTAPHDPRDAPDKFKQMYYKKKPPLPKNFLPQHPFDIGPDMTGRDEVLAPWPRPKDMIQDQLAEYYALITHMDEQIGRILAALEESGELENTLIIFASDNGLALGSHGLIGKQNVYEHSVGVPLLFAGPGIPKDQKRDALVYLYDIFPTVCEMNGLDAPKDIDGLSLVKAIAGKQEKVRDSVYFNYKHIMRSVRKNRWKLICYPQINHEQLFDLKDDPDEMNSLAEQKEHAKRIAELKALILTWEKDLGVPVMPLVSINPKPKKIDLTGHAREPDQWQPEWIKKKYFGK